MKYTTRKVEQEKNISTTIVAISLSAIITIMLITFYHIISYNEDKNESKYIIERIDFLTFESLLPKDFPHNTQIMCEEGITVYEYKELEKKTIFPCLYLNENNSCIGKNKVCLIKREVGK